MVVHEAWIRKSDASITSCTRCSFMIFHPHSKGYSHSYMLHRHAQWGAFRRTRAKPLTFCSTWNTFKSRHIVSKSADTKHQQLNKDEQWLCRLNKHRNMPTMQSPVTWLLLPNIIFVSHQTTTWKYLIKSFKTWRNLARTRIKVVFIKKLETVSFWGMLRNFMLPFILKKSLIFHVVMHGCEDFFSYIQGIHKRMVRYPFIHHWIRTILLCIPCTSEEYGAGIFENVLLIRIFGLQIEELEKMELHDQELHNFYTWRNVVRMVKTKGMLWTGIVLGGMG
jgi:hypothetical protein